MTRDELCDWVAGFNENAVVVEGHDDAVLGIAMRFGQEPIVVYDAGKIIATLMERDGMTEDDACEFYEFNILNAWMGEGTPTYVWLLTYDLGENIDKPGKGG